MFKTDEISIDKIEKNRYVELVNISLMPNHFHLLVKEIEEGGISRYMQRVLNSYTKYFNTKYGKSGHLFQGPYKIVHIETNEQLLYLSAYIHRNPRSLEKWKNKESKYPWSSFQDCLGENRWGNLLKHDIVTGQFSIPSDYREYVNTSGAKDEED
jgi:putative transposase